MLFDASPRTFYWVYSSFGPSYNEVEHGLCFVDGLHPHPVAGPIAEKAQLNGYLLVEHEGNEVFREWSRDDGRYWTPQFSSPGSNGGGSTGHLLPTLPPPEDWPDKLPESYLGLFDRYTPQGRVKRKYRGD